MLKLIFSIALFFPLVSTAEISFSQKLDLEYEFHQLEDELLKLKLTYEDQLADYNSAKETFEESKKPLRYLLGYVLNQIPEPQAKQEFTHVINNNRDLVYLSLLHKTGIGMNQTSFYKMEDSECLTLVPLEEINEAYILYLNNSKFETVKRYMSTSNYFMEFLYRYQANNEANERILQGGTIDEGRVFTELRSYQQMGAELAEYYSCDSVHAFRALEKDYQVKLNRYKQLSKTLSLPIIKALEEVTKEN